MKKLLTAVLVIAILLTLAPVTTASGDTVVTYPVEGGNIYFDTATGEVTDADDTVTATNIPSEINGVKVTAIRQYAFFKHYSLTSVSIPDSVTEIWGNSFKGCTELTAFSVSGGNTSYKSIDGVLYSFDGKELISYPAGKQGNKYSIPDGVTVIGDSAFSCSSLTDISIPDSVTEINYDAFFGCALTSVSIPNGVTKINQAVFSGCKSLTNVSIPNSVTLIAGDAFLNCISLTSVSIPDSVTEIRWNAFNNCRSLTSIFIPNGVTKIEQGAFSWCLSLVNIFIPDSVTVFEEDLFSHCSSLTDIYFSGTEAQWKTITINDIYGVDITPSAITIHYNSPAPDYVYNTPDPGADVAELPEYTADGVTDTGSATDAVSALTGAMSDEQKASATGVDLATLLAETAAARAASQAVKGKEIIISKATVSPLVEKSASAVQAVEDALVSGGVVTGRYLSSTVILTTTETGELTVKIDPDVLETEVDRVRIETPNYALTLKMSDLQADLTKVITIKVSGSGAATGTQAVTASVRGAFFMRPQETALLAPAGTTAGASVTLTLPGGKLTNPVTVSFPSDGDDSDETVVDTDGDVSSSKFNPATSTLDGKVTESGTYTTKSNSKDFTDIQDKSAEMQTAIRYLASKGIINGTGGTKFEPDGSIKRSEIAALIVRALGKLDSTARSTFTDVKPTDWYDSAVASCVKIKVLNGYTDNTFHGNNVILKQEILKVASNVLVQEMGYKEPKDGAPYLSRYSEKITADWILKFLPLVTRENLVVYRVDGTFSGELEMTRGDAAIILYRLFQRIW